MSLAQYASPYNNDDSLNEFAYVIAKKLNLVLLSDSSSYFISLLPLQMLFSSFKKFLSVIACIPRGHGYGFVAAFSKGTQKSCQMSLAIAFLQKKIFFRKKDKMFSCVIWQ